MPKCSASGRGPGDSTARLEGRMGGKLLPAVDAGGSESGDAVEHCTYLRALVEQQARVAVRLDSGRSMFSSWHFTLPLDLYPEVDPPRTATQRRKSLRGPCSCPTSSSGCPVPLVHPSADLAAPQLWWGLGRARKGFVSSYVRALLPPPLCLSAFGFFLSPTEEVAFARNSRRRVL